MKIIKANEVIIIWDYSPSGGGSRPIYSYYRKQALRGESIDLIRISSSNSFIKIFFLFFNNKRIIINGIASFQSWLILLLCLVKKNMLIYLHEAAPHIEPFKKRNPWKFSLFVSIISKRKVAFCSEWQKSYFLGYSKLLYSSVIYNNFSIPETLEKIEGRIAVCMVGYQTENKNVTFFSKLADEAFKNKVPYDFFWIGGDGGEAEKLYHSSHVKWVGDYEHIADFLNQVDVFLFTSQADCFPLSLLEAIAKERRIVSYKENGVAPFLENLKGCRVFDVFEVDTVLKLIEEVLNEETDKKYFKQLVNNLCSMENFEKRLRQAFEVKS